MRAALRLLRKQFLSKLLFAGFFVGLTSPALLIALVLQGQEDKLPGLSGIAVPWVVASLFASWSLAHRTLHYVFDQNQMFSDAFKRSWRDLRFKLASVPFLSHWFAAEEDQPHCDYDHDIRSHRLHS